MTKAKLSIIWDYDSAIGNVNATYPYKFDESKIYQEVHNVEKILNLCQVYQIKMTFACVGFGAEPGQFPYHIPEQIKKIHTLGHEIASHSWKHEWFPFLEREQVERSLARSKYALETCIGKQGAVVGFVPPFSRPMSWYTRGAVSLGDRVFGPWYPGASLGSLIKIAQGIGYKWFRISYRPIWKKILKKQTISTQLAKPWTVYNNIRLVPNHYVGFDGGAIAFVHEAINQCGQVVISGHPSGISRSKSESVQYLERFLDFITEQRKNSLLEIGPINNIIKDFAN